MLTTNLEVSHSHSLSPWLCKGSCIFRCQGCHTILDIYSNIGYFAYCYTRSCKLACKRMRHAPATFSCPVTEDQWTWSSWWGPWGSSAYIDHWYMLAESAWLMICYKLGSLGLGANYAISCTVCWYLNVVQFGNSCFSTLLYPINQARPGYYQSSQYESQSCLYRSWVHCQSCNL